MRQASRIPKGYQPPKSGKVVFRMCGYKPNNSLFGAQREKAPMNQELHDKLLSLAIEAHSEGEESLAIVLSTIYGCYRTGAIKDFQVISQLYLGHGAIFALREMLKETKDPLYSE